MGGTQYVRVWVRRSSVRFGPVMFANWHLLTRLQPFHRPWAIGVLSSLMITFPRDRPQIVTEMALNYKPGKRLEEGLFTSQRGRADSALEHFLSSKCRKKRDVRA